MSKHEVEYVEEWEELEEVKYCYQNIIYEVNFKYNKNVLVT